MAERRLLIKEMWNEFASTLPNISASERSHLELAFYAGAVHILKLLTSPDNGPNTALILADELENLPSLFGGFHA